LFKRGEDEKQAIVLSSEKRFQETFLDNGSQIEWNEEKRTSWETRMRQGEEKRKATETAIA